MNSFLFATLSLLLTSPALAESDFERGYNAGFAAGFQGGQNSCQQQPPQYPFDRPRAVTLAIIGVTAKCAEGAGRTDNTVTSLNVWADM